MNNYRFATEEREPVRAYTPSHTSDEDLPGVSSSSLGDKSYRLFSFRKEGRSWVNSICTESRISENDIKKRAKRPRKPTHGVEHQLERMSPPRRSAIEELLEKTNRKDPDGLNWDIVAIDNDKPDLTKRTGEVTAFSVILARVNAVRQGTNSVSRERRRSIYRSSEEDYNVFPARRDARPYSSGRASPGAREDKNTRQSQAYMHTRSLLEEDPFGVTQLFTSDGKPVGASGPAMYANAALPPHITQDEPIGAPIQKEKTNAKKQQKAQKTDLWQTDDLNDEVIDLDALLGSTTLGGNNKSGTGKQSGGKQGGNKMAAEKLIYDDFGIDHYDDHHDDFDMPIEIIGVEKEKPRGRKQDSTWKANKQDPAMTQSKPKSKTRPLSVSIPKGQYDRREPPPEVTPAGNRKQQTYWSSRETAHSVPSDQSVLEAEYEDYSSSGSSDGFEQDWSREEAATYQPANSRYQQATNYHRRGPPSPQQPRYDAVYEQQPQPVQRRPTRAERIPSDSAVQRYSYTPQPAKRPPIISQQSAPRFVPTPTSAHPGAGPVASYAGYGYDSGMTPYPVELSRRDSVQARDAEQYMRMERDKDREIELLQRERDLARREAELHQEVARRASVSQRPGSKYNHEPRLSRRYTTYNN